MRRRLLFALALPALLAGTAPGFAQPPFPPVPEPKYEPVPPPPGVQEAWLWQQGTWHWDGNRYVWRTGTWIERRVGFHEFIPGHWEHHEDGWMWESAHWR